MPQVFLDVDRAKAESMHVPLNAVWDTLSIYLGSLYVNDFNRFRPALPRHRAGRRAVSGQAEDVKNLKTRNASGEMVPLGTLVQVQDINAPVLAGHFNMFPTAEILGSTAPGVSSGEAIQLMEDLAEKVLPPGMRIEWTELSLLQILAGNTAVYIFPLCVLMMFLVLAAQYESWSLPLAIILIVPMCLLFAILGVWLRGLDNNLFTQIGLVVLMGLACKNAILIVEFAKQLQDAGRNRTEAAIEASRLRLRPILMTSFAFTFGVIPLMLSTAPARKCGVPSAPRSSSACWASPSSAWCSRRCSTCPAPPSLGPCARQDAEGGCTRCWRRAMRRLLAWVPRRPWSLVAARAE